MNRQGPLGHIFNLIDSGFPLIYLLSHEEERVIKHLESMAADMAGKQVPLYTWAITKGLLGPNKMPVLANGLADPMVVLDSIERFESACFFVLLDFHPYLTDNCIIRKVRDLYHSLRGTGKVVFFLSSVQVLPPELVKHVYVLDYPLPDATEIERVIEEELALASRRWGRTLNPLTADREPLVRTLLGLTEEEARHAIRLVLSRRDEIDTSVIDELLEQKRQAIKKSEILDYIPRSVAIEDVGGLRNFKRWCTVRSGGFSKRAREFGLPQPRGVLVTGISGCGKSLAIQFLASLWNLPLLRLDMGRVFAGFAGSPEESMRRAILTVEAVAPAILWIDEIEMGISVFSDSVESGATSRIFAMFLTWMQEKTRPVFIGATANDIDRLPPEFIRKGRFDEIFFVDLPDEQDRMEIFRAHLRKRGKEISDANLEGLAKFAVGYSGAEIEQAVIAAMYEAFSDSRELTVDDIYSALSRMVPLAVTMKEQIIKTKRWAENRAVRAS